MNVSKPPEVASRPEPSARVGRLSPLPAVATRAHPDRRQVRQFLKELRLPLAASQSMLDLVRDVELPETVQLALAAVRNHNEFLDRLAADYAEFGHLEQNTVMPKPAEVELRPWLDSVTAAATHAAAELGVDVVVTFRSFLPSAVAFDHELVARAFDSVLHVAMQRSMPGRLDVSVSFEESREAGVVSHLVFDVTTRGGGFSDVEQGYLFMPFQVRDAAARPLLGLSLGHRLAELLGGQLRVQSAGAAVCSYRLSVSAEPVDHAVWLDPVAQQGHLGPVRPGRVLFVGRCARTVARCRPALERAGYAVERVEREELTLSRIETQPTRWSAVVLDATCTGDTLPGFVGAIRELGYGAGLLALGAASGEALDGVAGVDATLRTPDGAELLAALQSLRDYSDRRNATSAS